MFPVLILRCELVCLVILVFLYFTSRSYNISSESKAFNRLLFFALIHVVFDIITVLTVNQTDTVPLWLNWICHVFFYLSAIFFSNEIVNYVIAICYPGYAKKLYALGHILISIYICCLPFLRIYYIQTIGTCSSAGPAAIVGYGLAFLFFSCAILMILTHMNIMTPSIKSALIPMMLVLMIAEVCQIIWPSILFTGSAVTIVTVGFFFSLENPVSVFRQKALFDALTGVRSRSSYEEDIDRFDRHFQKDPNNDYCFVFIDLNNLRVVNNRFGHAEGDNYITLIAKSMKQCMKHCSAIYRIGGDEFLVYYNRTDVAIIVNEINELHSECNRISMRSGYTVAISVGYAVSSSSNQSLKDVVRTADYAMYCNKAAAKSRKDSVSSAVGTKINYSGLTDKIFDALCAANDRSYPFITNMETNVTRISPEWSSYFGLDDEFFADFLSIWKCRIQPDYVEGYVNDLLDVINKRQRYHHYDCFARRIDGEYVRISCRGSIYRDSSSGITYFSGFIVNHGLDDNTDPVTGLKNYDELTSRIYKLTDRGTPFSVLKLRLNNFARIDMLYGYNEGNKLLKTISMILTDEIGSKDNVFCQDSVNFTILLDTYDEQTVEDYYSKISGRLAAGLDVTSIRVPVFISGGAYINKGESCCIQLIRSGLLFATEESHSNQRNNLVFYHGAHDTQTDTDVSLLAMIHADALADQKHFQLYYQPIIDMSNGETVGAEALLRWIHPVFGVIPPRQYIAFLENDPCYYRLGLSILEWAVRDAKRVREMIPKFKISVNITALQLQDRSFISNVLSILQKYDCDPGNLVLELTERCKEMDFNFLSKRIAKLRSKGILVAFDDFGTGYSTINLLMNIPVDEIKLDKDFVQELRDRENYRLFANTIVSGRSSSGNHYTICFEGIENEEVLREARKYGDFLAQGYYFAKPLPIEELITYVRSVI